MIQLNSWDLYTKVSGNASIYEESVHCPMIMEYLNRGATVDNFCVDIGISNTTFYRWLRKHWVFRECYQIGLTIAKYNWEQELEDRDDTFDIDEWKMRGAIRGFLSKVNRVRLMLTPEASPYEQYQELIEQANSGDFTASELKQLMEGINVGRVAYEAFKLQEEIDQMKQDIKKMGQSNEHNIIPIAPIAKTN